MKIARHKLILSLAAGMAIVLLGTASQCVDNQETSGDEGKKPVSGTLQKSEKLDFYLETYITGLDVPWGMTWLPDGDLLVTERSGKLYRYSDGQRIASIDGLPEIFVNGQGGLMDIQLHPDYENNGWLYFTYAAYGPGGKSEGGNTALMRARLDGNTLVDKEVIWKAGPNSRSTLHFGSRIAFDNDGYLYVAVGERGVKPNAQDLTIHGGKVHRLHDNGDIPEDNPFVNTPGAVASTYSYGHRNPQGMAKDPKAGLIWVNEHGPKGGDELNLIKKGANYGWPVITYGIDYDGSIISNDTHMEGMEQPAVQWTPSPGVSGLAFVSGEPFKAWEGSVLSGALALKYLLRTELVNNEVVHEEVLLKDIGRVRHVAVGPDGLIYVAVETPGVIYRLVPAE